MLDREITFADFEEGRKYPPFDFVISEAQLKSFEQCFSVGPLMRPGGIELKGTERVQARRPLSAFLLNNFHAIRASMKMPNGVLHARETVRLHAPAYVGEALQLMMAVKSKYRKNDKPFIELEQVIVRRSDNAKIMSFERTLFWPK
jgi:hypothetical protein